MQFKLMVTAGLLLATTTTAISDGLNVRQAQNNQLAVNVELQARHVTRKPVWVSLPRHAPSQMVVKFLDETQMRAFGGSVRSLAGIQVNEVDALCNRYDLAMRPIFEHSEQTLQNIQAKAQMSSGRIQPDLAGIMWVDTPENATLEQLEEAANALNALGSVEYVEFMLEPVLHSNGTLTNSSISQETIAAAATTAGGGNTPNFNADQLSHFLYNDFDGDNFWDFEDDPINEFFIGGFDMPAMANMGDFLNSEGLTAVGWDTTKNGARGATIRVGIVEFSCLPKHEDLRIRVEPGQKLLPPRLATLANVNHGTATSGQIFARDHGLPGPDRRQVGDNAELGTIGLVPDAQGWFFPIVSITGGSRLPTAMASAINLFGYGDVLNFSIGFPGSGPLITSQTIANIIRVASDAGITCVMSAGNDCLNMDESAFPDFDTGAIVVGAGHPTEGTAGPFAAVYTRLGFSNHYSVANLPTTVWTEERRIWSQAWGRAILTLGYGDLFDPNENLGRHDMRRLVRQYTSSFGGTSSAAPMVAAMAASIQGLSKMFFGIPLDPSTVRELMADNFNLFGQEGRIRGANEEDLSGTADPPEASPCDETAYDTEEDPDIIAGFPTAQDYFNVPGHDTILEALFNLNIFGDSILTDWAVIKGNLIVGHVNSLKRPEGIAALISSKYVNGGTENNVGRFPAPTYFFIGETTDVGAVATAVNPQEVRSLAVTVRLAASAQGTAFMGFEIYDRAFARWTWIGMDTAYPVYPDLIGVPLPVFPIAGAQNYVDQTTGDILLRVWVYGFGFGTFEFTSAYDWIEVTTFSAGFGGGI